MFNNDIINEIKLSKIDNYHVGDNIYSLYADKENHAEFQFYDFNVIKDDESFKPLDPLNFNLIYHVCEVNLNINNRQYLGNLVSHLYIELEKDDVWNIKAMFITSQVYFFTINIKPFTTKDEAIKALLDFDHSNNFIFNDNVENKLGDNDV